MKSFQRTGNLPDLVEAISANQQAVRLTHVALAVQAMYLTSQKPS